MKKPLMLLVAGLPGTGKSYFAERIAEKIDARILRTDEIRKELAGLKEDEHSYEEFGRGLYTEEMTQKTYEQMYKRAREILTEGSSCILDATFSKRIQREGAYEITKELNAPYLTIECISSDEVVKERIEKRCEDENTVSDATFEIYSKMKELFEPVGKEEPHLTIDTSKDTEGNLQLLLDWIERQV